MKKLIIIPLILLFAFSFAQKPEKAFDKIEKSNTSKASEIFTEYKEKQLPYFNVIVPYGFAKIKLKEIELNKIVNENNYEQAFFVTLEAYDEAYSLLNEAENNYSPNIEILNELSITSEAIVNDKDFIRNKIKTIFYDGFNPTNSNYVFDRDTLKYCIEIRNKFPDKNSGIVIK